MFGPPGTKHATFQRALGIVESAYSKYKKTMPTPKGAGKTTATWAPPQPPLHSMRNQMNVLQEATVAPPPQMPINQMDVMSCVMNNHMLAMMNPLLAIMNMAQQQPCMPQVQFLAAQQSPRSNMQQVQRLATQVVFVAWAVAQGWAVAQTHMKQSCFAPRCPPRPKNEGKWSPQKVKAQTFKIKNTKSKIKPQNPQDSK